MLRAVLIQAPRLPLRACHGLARGACLALALVTAGAAAAEVTPACVLEANYAQPTDAYVHGVLGDAIEYRAIEMRSTGVIKQGTGGVRQSRLSLRLPSERVFEDIAPRLVDIDLDGCAEVMAVETEFNSGARLSIYDGRGMLKAATPHIGTRNRWLAPVGAADLDGDGAVEIAYVDRPHLAKTLRIWRYGDGKLTEIASLQGVSNHQIGWDYIEGGIRDCGKGPEMIVASGDWRSVLAVTYNGQISTQILGTYSSAAMQAAMNCR